MRRFSRRVSSGQNNNLTAGKISLAAMFVAMTMVLLYCSVLIPALKVSFYFLSSVFIFGMLIERQVAVAAVMYVLECGIALLILPIYMALPFILLFGHYGIGKFLLETNLPKIAGWILKWIYFNIGLALIYFLVIRSGVFFVEQVFYSLPIWAWALIAQPVFVVYDFLYSKVIVFYVNAIRSKLIRD